MYPWIITVEKETGSGGGRCRCGSVSCTRRGRTDPRCHLYVVCVPLWPGIRWNPVPPPGYPAGTGPSATHGYPLTSTNSRISTSLSFPIIYSQCPLQDPNGRKLSCLPRRAVLLRHGNKNPRFPSFKPFTQPHSLSTGMAQQQLGHWDLHHPFVLSRALVVVLRIVLSHPCRPIHPRIPAQPQASFP